MTSCFVDWCPPARLPVLAWRRLTQLIIEYLLYVQESLHSHALSLEQRAASLRDSSRRLADQVQRQADKIRALKRLVRQRAKTVKTYEYMLRNQKPGGRGAADGGASVFRCLYCPKVLPL